ncbi:MAG: DUF2971 domain-containing protein [Clostridia bacterium]|nr:DUF2971 domain-containing protein [Clostridia bacterium]
MNKGDEFYNLLLPIQIDSTMNSETMSSQLQPLVNWLSRNTPAKLYRFFSGNERSIEQFKKDEIWGSRASTFNDPYECLPSFDMDRINNDLVKALDIESLKEFFEAVKNGYRLPQMAGIPDKLMQSILAFLNQPDFYEQLESKFSFFRDQIILWWQSICGEVIYKFFNLFNQSQRQQYITCFTENQNATLMWAHYANSHKGFCLEYNWGEIVAHTNNCLAERKILLMPVKYSEKRFDASSYIFPIIQDWIKTKMNLDFELYFSDFLIYIKILLTKSLDWSYESEWRMFSSIPDAEPETDFRIQLIHRPTAVYLGAKMPQEKSDMIEQLCMEKEIPCYKMLQSYNDNRFVVEPELYSVIKERAGIHNP